MDTKNVFDVGVGFMCSEEIGKHLKRRKRESVETKNIFDVKKLQ